MSIQFPFKSTSVPVFLFFKPVTPASCQGLGFCDCIDLLSLSLSLSLSLGAALRPPLVWVCGETEPSFRKFFRHQQQITTGSCEESTAVGTQRAGRGGGMLSSAVCEQVSEICPSRRCTTQRLAPVLLNVTLPNMISVLREPLTAALIV